MASRKVFVLYTGGTFGMAPDLSRPGHPLAPQPLAALADALPTVRHDGQDVAVKFDSLPEPLDSSSIQPGDWLAIARHIVARYDDHDGFVIIHGTDTLAWTASALAFLFDGLAKPVIVTGSQKPLGVTGSDAPSNYTNAVALAAAGNVADVAVVFGRHILRGCRVSKIDTSHFDGFDSPNAPRLGTTMPTLQVDTQCLRSPDGSRPFTCADALSSSVIEVPIWPGIKPDHLRAILAMDDVRGVVFRSFGSGNAPDTPDFAAALKEGLGRGIVAVNTTRCARGTVDAGTYAAGSAFVEAGVVPGHDITPEAAFAKLCVLLGTMTPEQARRAMMQDLRGEMTVA